MVVPLPDPGPLRPSVRAESGEAVLPPGEAFFGCRECHGLTYQSRQEHRCGMGLLGAVAGRTGRDVADVRRMMRPKIMLQRAYAYMSK